MQRLAATAFRRLSHLQQTPFHHHQPRAFLSAVLNDKETGLRLPGYVGLEFDPNWSTTLQNIYAQTKTALQEIPPNSVYRTNVEKLINFRMKVLQEDAKKGVGKVEDIIGVGPIEQVIEQAKDELELVEEMKGWKPWENEKELKIEIID